MKLIRNLPIEKKMLATILLTSVVVLCIAIAALFAYQLINFRSGFQRETTTFAVVIANNSTAAMAFKDDLTATEVVGALAAKPTVVSASLVFPNGSLFAHYGQPESAGTLSEFPSADGFRFSNDELLVTQTVKLKGDRLGTLYLRSDYRKTLVAMIRIYGLVVVAIMVISICLALFLSSLLGRGITGPILELARTARVVGELKDYSVRAAVIDSTDELGRLGESFNNMLGRIQSQDSALNLSQQKMEALIHSIDGIVWERSTDSLRYTFISRQSESILGFAPKEWLDNPGFWKERLHPDDAEKAVQTGRLMAERGQPYSYEYRMLAVGDKTVWIRESGMVLLESGKPVAMRGIFQDITRQKLDAEQLDRLNRQLIDTSRSAGMADIATGVLHNVGNVLNSVTVSAALVGEQLKSSKVAKVCRVASMLRAQNGNVAQFLTTDPKGKLIPEFIVSVADELAEEQKDLMAKMSIVNEHVGHISEIVAMQQSYAKVSGVFEDLNAAELMEDALRINATAFDRHHIDLVKEFEKNTPPVRVDRHKVLQILINLLRNAKHAMEEQSEHSKRLLVRVSIASPNAVRITVADNGIGIPSDNMTKIFNHGFTTKKDGHGFGLHGGANAAKEMGGSLTARSEGSGKGAEFTLELPTSHRN